MSKVLGWLQSKENSHKGNQKVAFQSEPDCWPWQQTLAWKRERGMAFTQNFGARWANHGTKPICPPQPDFSLQTGSRYIYSVSSERGILLFKARHSHWVQLHGEGATEKSKGFEKRWRFPTSEIHASLPCKGRTPYYGMATLWERQTGMQSYLQLSFEYWAQRPSTDKEMI